MGANINYWEEALKNPPQSYVHLFEKESEYLREHIKKDQAVLDVGCGEGRNILSILDITTNITGVDIDEKAVHDTQQNMKEHPEVHITLGDVTNLPFQDKTFDVVVFSMTLVNMDDKKTRALSEMKRVAKDDAKLIVSVYSEKAREERMEMYTRVNVPIVSEKNGRFVFGVDGMVSEQFSIPDIEALIEPLDLAIENYTEVGNLAYILTLVKK